MVLERKSIVLTLRYIAERTSLEGTPSLEGLLWCHNLLESTATQPSSGPGFRWLIPSEVMDLPVVNAIIGR